MSYTMTIDARVGKPSLVKRLFQNKYWVAGILIIGFIALGLWLFPEVLADYTNTQGVKDNFDNFIRGAQESSVEKMKDAYDSFAGVYKPQKQGGIMNFTSVLQGVVGTLAGAAISILFAVNIIKEAQKGDLSPDYWQRIIINLAISLVVTLLSTRIMGAIYELGNIVVNTFAKSISTDGSGYILNISDKNEMATLLSHIPGMEKLPDIVGSGGETVVYNDLTKANEMLVYMEYIVWFPMVIAVFLMYSAIFEIKIRELFAPLAVASIMTEGSRSSGARFLKKYAACFLKIAIYFGIAFLGMMLTHYFYGLAQGDANSNELSLNLIYMLMSNVVAGMAMMQTGGLADEIIGV